MSIWYFKADLMPFSLLKNNEFFLFTVNGRTYIKICPHLKSVNLEDHVCSPSGSLPNKEERMVKNLFASSESYSEATIWAVIVDAFSRLTSKTKCIFTLSSFFPLSIQVSQVQLADFRL